MRPVLFDISLFGWDIAIPTYGFLLALGFLAALWIGMKQARMAGIESNVVTDIWIVSLLSGIVGAKLLLYLINLPYYMANPGAILGTLRSAGVWYGGLVVAVGATLIAVRRRGLDGWLMGDIAAPAIALGQSIGRLGCFAAGCCYGGPCTLPWAVTFTDSRAHEITGVPLNQPLHPTQLYHAFSDFGLFLVLLWTAANKRFRGQVLLIYLILYAALRGWIEIYRNDDRGEFAGLSTSQIISIAVGGVALFLYYLRRPNAPAHRDA